MATVVEGQTAEKTQIIFIRSASSDIAIKWGDSHVVHDITWWMFATADRVVSNVPNKPRHIRHQIHHPF